MAEEDWKYSEKSTWNGIGMLVKMEEAEEKLAEKDKEIERLKKELDEKPSVRDMYENGPLW